MAKNQNACIDEQSKCQNSDGTKGHAYSCPANRARVCYYNAIEIYEELTLRPANICDLVDIIIDEFGHANGYPKGPNHNGDLADPQKRDGLHYQIGFIARDFCKAEAGKFSNHNLWVSHVVSLAKPVRRMGNVLRGNVDQVARVYATTMGTVLAPRNVTNRLIHRITARAHHPDWVIHVGAIANALIEQNADLPLNGTCIGQ